jgi:hypothetical protein
VQHLPQRVDIRDAADQHVRFAVLGHQRGHRLLELGPEGIGWGHGRRRGSAQVVGAQQDTGVTADQLVQRVLAAARPGAIVLLHDGGGNRSATVAALPAIIDGLRRLG